MKIGHANDNTLIPFIDNNNALWIGMGTATKVYIAVFHANIYFCYIVSKVNMKNPRTEMKSGEHSFLFFSISHLIPLLTDRFVQNIE